MELFPAIDVRDGHCVRLHQGDYGRETRYGDDPVAQAAAFIDDGATWIHVVDLDAARSGSGANRSVIEAISALARSNGVRVQCGGGVRTLDSARELADAGVHRVVMGTAALENPSIVTAVAARQEVAVGLDARGSELAGHGWEVASGQDLVEVATAFADAGVSAFVVTEISRDGTLEGPATGQLRQVMEAVSGSGAEVVASGGIGTLEDLTELDGLVVGGRPLGGAIIGKALYEGRFSLAEALGAVR